MSPFNIRALASITFLSKSKYDFSAATAPNFAAIPVIPDSSLSDLKTTRDELRGKLSILVVATTDKDLIDVIFSRREILTAFVNQNPDMGPWGLSDFNQATTQRAVLPLEESKLNVILSEGLCAFRFAAP